MIEATRRLVESSRLCLARAASLSWTRLGPLDLAIPAAAILTAVDFWSERNRPIYGLPFELTFVGLWLALVAVGLAGLAVWRRFLPDRVPPGDWPLACLILVVVSGWLTFDVVLWQGSNHLYDLDVYLASAGRWLDGGQPYMTAPVTSWPDSASEDFFLYPPPLLPLFGLLSKLPNPAVTLGWETLIVACGYFAFRAIGLRPLWSLLLLAFPPVTFGFESGNVASLVFLLFALGYRTGGWLVVDGMSKVQSGLPALWLVRTRRWRGLLSGLVVVGLAVAVTLPLVGVDSWRDWVEGLGHRAASQSAVLPLYGFSYARQMPDILFGSIAVFFVALALLFSGRRGLAALGLASIFASPALWPHGFAFALPAVLMLESGTLVWLALGAGSIESGMWLLFYLGWVAVLAAPRVPDRLHPMAGTDGPWLDAGAEVGSEPAVRRANMSSAARDMAWAPANRRQFAPDRHLAPPPDPTSENPDVP